MADAASVNATVGSGSAFFTSANVNRAGGTAAGTVIAQNATVTGVTLSGAKAGNYVVGSSLASGTITPAVLTVTADNTSKFTGLSDPTFTASYSGFVNGENAASAVSSLTFSRVAGETSGSAYAITPTAVASNYAVTARTGTLSIIGFDTLLVTVGNSSAVYGSLSGNLNARAAYAKNTGTVNNPYTTVYTWTPTGSTAGSSNSLTLTFSDATALAPNVNTISVTISSAAGATSNVGTYAITAATPVNTQQLQR